MTELLVQARRVSKTFGEQRALDDVSFGIDRGEIHALVGENGSGKSTLIKILSGYHTPDRGSEISVAGQSLVLGSPADSYRRGMRFVHQNLGLVDELDAVDNMGLAAGFATGPMWTVKRREQESRARQLLAPIGIDVDLGVPVARLRPVERSALAIARALDAEGGEIRLLVLDEPTAALPPVEVSALFKVVRDIVARGVSVLYVSHRLDEILAIADRVSVLRDGGYQGTFEASGLSRDDIVRHILGHSLSEPQQATAVAADAPEPAAAAPPAAAPPGATPGPGAQDAPPGLKVAGLRTAFLRGISFQVRKGEVLGFAGLDGSGRDELAGALGGAVRAEGEVTDARGRRIASLTARAFRRHGIALVLPNWHAASAVTQFDLRENISLASLSRSSRLGVVRRRAEADQALHWLQAVDVRPPLPEKTYGELSGGNKQKVIVARWLATSPDVLVLDDPTSGVDVGARQQIYDLVRAQAARGLSVVLCSSDLEDLVELCDRVVCLVDGSVSEELSAPQLTEVHLLRAITASAAAPVPGTSNKGCEA
jgi:ribose transport system ATP-binding protein